MTDRLHRLIAATGDGSTIFRTARNGRASATVFVGSPTGSRATEFDRNITLFVEPDGSWSVVTQTARQADMVTVASGHVAEMTAAPEGEVQP